MTSFWRPLKRSADQPGGISSALCVWQSWIHDGARGSTSAVEAESGNSIETQSVEAELRHACDSENKARPGTMLRSLLVLQAARTEALRHAEWMRRAGEHHAPSTPSRSEDNLRAVGAAMQTSNTVGGSEPCSHAPKARRFDALQVRNLPRVAATGQESAAAVAEAGLSEPPPSFV